MRILVAAFLLAFIFFSINKRSKQKELEKKLLNEYLEYYESMKGKDTVKSYEEFKQEFVNLIQKEREEAAKIYLENSKFERTRLNAFLEGLHGGLRTASTNRSGRKKKK